MQIELSDAELWPITIFSKMASVRNLGSKMRITFETPHSKAHQNRPQIAVFREKWVLNISIVLAYPKRHILVGSAFLTYLRKILVHGPWLYKRQNPQKQAKPCTRVNWQREETLRESTDTDSPRRCLTGDVSDSRDVARDYLWCFKKTVPLIKKFPNPHTIRYDRRD